MYKENIKGIKLFFERLLTKKENHLINPVKTNIMIDRMAGLADFS